MTQGKKILYNEDNLNIMSLYCIICVLHDLFIITKRPCLIVNYCLLFV